MLYPILIEKKFAAESERFVDALRAYVLETFEPEIRTISDRAERERIDDAFGPGDGHWSSDLQRTINRLKAKAEEIAATAEPLAESASYKVDQWTNKEIRKLEKILPPEFLAANPARYNPENIRNSLRKAWSKNYAGLITSVTSETATNVGRIVYEGFTSGESYASIQKKILAGGPIEALKNPPFNTARKRARIIARDQIGKLNGQLIKKRQTQLGIDSYIWRTSLDERVRGNPSGRYPKAVPSHFAREGKVFNWDTPPEGGHPGEAILCRCTAEPYIEGVTGEGGEAGVSGKAIEPAQSLGNKIAGLRAAAATALNLATTTATEAIRALSTAEAAANELGVIVDGILGIEGELDELAKKAATLKIKEKIKAAEDAKAAAVGISLKAQKAKAAAEKVQSAKVATPATKAQAAAALSHVSNVEETLATLDKVIGKAQAAQAAAGEKLAAALAMKKAKAAAKIEAQKNAKIASTIDASEWKYKSPKQGSNPGGIYEDKAGARYIVKVMDEEHAINELLASKLYKAAGVNTSEMLLVDGIAFKGEKVRAIAGRWIDGLQSGAAELKSGKFGPGGYIDGAGVDMWLANWDAVGLDMDNILKDTAGNLVRIDVGAAMKFRAQGQKKAFESDKVPELETFVNGKNDQISPILAAYSEDDITRSLEKVANFTDETIDEVIDTVWKGTTLSDKTREEYRAALKGRRDVIRAEWVKRGGPKLSGGTLPGSEAFAAPKSFDPFDDYKVGDPIPFLSPEQSDYFIAKYKSNGNTTMKNALIANGLESDKNLITYPADVVDDVKEWQAAADKALEGKGPFPKPLDISAINKKVKAAEDAKAAALKAANKLEAEALNKQAEAGADKAEKVLDIAIDELYTVENSKYSIVKKNAETALDIVAESFKAAKKAEVLGYKMEWIFSELLKTKRNAETLLDTDEYKAIQKKAVGAVSKKAVVVGKISGAEKEARRKELGRDNTRPEAALFTVDDRPLIHTADGFNVVYADDTKYAKTPQEAGILGADGYKVRRGEGRKHWASIAEGNISGPWVSGKNKALLSRDGVTDADYDPKYKDAYNVLRDYTGGSYTSRNNYLRGSYKPGALTIQKYEREHKAAAALIREHTVKKPFVVWRGSNRDFIDKIIAKEGKRFEDLVGTVYTEHGFMSTTSTHSAAFEENTLFRINVPKGAKAIPARHLSQIKNEDEFIFPPETRFYISDVQNIDSSDDLNNGGRYSRIVTVEILPEV